MGAEGLGEHFAGTTACLSALNAARRHEELLALMSGARLNWWGYRQYGVDALIALNRSAEALRYAETWGGGSMCPLPPSPANEKRSFCRRA
jgi:hypothetical protein